MIRLNNNERVKHIPSSLLQVFLIVVILSPNEHEKCKRIIYNYFKDKYS